ncbi:hypothetical protein P7C73_g4935, partial [Tremellales sp. Uapishka_1]
MAEHGSNSRPSSCQSDRSRKSVRRYGSTKSTKSTKSSKRGSTSTTSHRTVAGRRWEVGVPAVVDEDLLELSALVGRAVVLERMLRAGKRLSSSRPGSSAHSHALSVSRSLHQRLNSVTATLSKASSQSHSQPSPAPRTSRETSLSLRKRLSRKLQRTRSREDIFTELDSDDDDPNLFPVESTHGHGVVEKGGKGEEEGVVVFPEIKSTKRDILPPPTPPKPLAFCTMTPISAPASPIEEKPYARPPQSPHLGHRSPNQRNRLSVMSRLTQGSWNDRTRKKFRVAMAVGVIVVVILVTGLLGGLLSHKSDKEQVECGGTFDGC